MSEENKIIQTIQEIGKALEEKDLESMMKHYALNDPRFSGFEDAPPFRRVHSEEWKKLFEEFLSNIGSINTEKHDVEVHVFQDVAVVTGYERWRAEIQGMRQSGNDRFSWILVKEKEEWKVIHEQFTRIDL